MERKWRRVSPKDDKLGKCTGTKKGRILGVLGLKVKLGLWQPAPVVRCEPAIAWRISRLLGWLKPERRVGISGLR